MMYLQASLKLYPGKQQDFVKLLNDLMPSLNKHGWKLVGSFAAVVGRLNSAVDCGKCLMPRQSLRSCPIRNSRSRGRESRRSWKMKC